MNTEDSTTAQAAISLVVCAIQSMHYCQFQSLVSHQLPSLSILHESVFRSQYIRSPCPSPCSMFLQRLYQDLWPGFVSMSPARIIRIARLSPFDELKRRNLSELLRLPSFLMLENKWGSIRKHFATSSAIQVCVCRFLIPFAHFQRMKPRTTATGNMNGSYLTWNLTIFFCPIPIKPATILTPTSRDWWTKLTGKGPYLPLSFQSQDSDSVFATEHWQTTRS